MTTCFLVSASGWGHVRGVPEVVMRRGQVRVRRRARANIESWSGAIMKEVRCESEDGKVTNTNDIWSCANNRDTVEDPQVDADERQKK